jgi:DNA polymerase I
MINGGESDAQSTLGGWNAGDDDRPAGEAEHVAGNGSERAEFVDIDNERFPPTDKRVQLSVTQVDYTVEGYGDDEFPVLHVFGRRETPQEHTDSATGNEQPKAVHVRIYGFRPYFYTPLAKLDYQKTEGPVTTADLTDSRIIEESRLTGVETYGDLRGKGEIVASERADDEIVCHQSIRDEELVKVFGQTPRDVGQLRDQFDHYEADILFPNRLLIDKDVTSGVSVPARDGAGDAFRVHHTEVRPVDLQLPPRINTFDIEVDDRSGFPEEGEEPILCLTSHDSYTDEYVVWLYKASDEIDAPTDLKEYDPIAEGDIDVTVRAFDQEPDMLDAFMSYIEQTDPDIMTGWNFDDFDAPYLIDRIARLVEEGDADPEMMDADRLSRVDEVWDSGWGGPNVKGRVVFDLLYAYKRRQFTELDSYRLDAVGETELGVGKERYTGDIGDLWEQDPKRLLEYNLRDVELCVEIDRRQEVIPFWEEVASFVGCKLEDATTPGDAVDLYILHEVHGKFALPSKGAVDSEDYEGGAVFDPITGVREMVSVLDLKSLYPMCMVTLNLSPETYIADPDAYAGETYVAPNGMHFQREPDGIIREMVTNLLEERENKKSLRDEHEPSSEAYATYDSQQAAVKVIMNSLYGVLGWDRFRLYDKDMGAAVTATGREVINYTEQSVKELEHEVAYGDSVTGDRPVVTRDPKDRVQIIQIATLFEHADRLVNDDVLITADGGPVGEATVRKERGTLDNWEALSLSDTGEAEWQQIEQVIRHDTDKPVVNLQHERGESTTTRDHSYITSTADGHVATPPTEVDTPLRIPTLPGVDEIESIDLYDLLREPPRGHPTTQRQDTAESVQKTESIQTNGEWMWIDDDRSANGDSPIRMKRHIACETAEFRGLLRLLAAFLAKGSVVSEEIEESLAGVIISGEQTDWLDCLCDDCERLFENANPTVVTDNKVAGHNSACEDSEIGEPPGTDTPHVALQFMNQLSAVFFQSIVGRARTAKRIPSFIFHLSNDKQSLFLDTLMNDGELREASQPDDEDHRLEFAFETRSSEVAAGLSMLLTQREQSYSLSYDNQRASYTLRGPSADRSDGEPVLAEVDHTGYVYDLSVAHNENFVDGVGGIVLHNTDSVMIEFGDGLTVDQAIEQSFSLEESINQSYEELAESMNAEEHRFQIEFEKLYRRFFQAGKKKRYAGHIVWKEGKDVDDIDITGFEYKRSDIAPITKEVQKEVIEMVVTGTDLDEVKTYVHDVITEFQKGDVPLERIGIPGGIGKKLDAYDTDTAQVRGAKYANTILGTNFGRGSKPKRLYLDRVHDDFFRRTEHDLGLDPADNVMYGEFKREQDVICFEFADQVPEEFEVDWDKMLDRTLKGPIARILEAMGVSWEEVKSGQEQTGLGSFM